MVEENKTVIQIFQQRGAMGLVKEVLDRSETTRTKANHERIKKILSDIFPSGKMRRDVFQQNLEQVLYEEETILVVFRKEKKNTKFGHKKVFNQGFSYYIGYDIGNLSKVYIHWKEEKKFLLNNVQGLETDAFSIEAQGINIGNIFWLNIILHDSDSKKKLGEISLYVGYKANE